MVKVDEVLKTQPPTYTKGDINGEIIECKYYEQELLIPAFDFESYNKVLESLNINIRLEAGKLDRTPASYKEDQGTCFADSFLL